MPCWADGPDGTFRGLPDPFLCLLLFAFRNLLHRCSHCRFQRNFVCCNLLEPLTLLAYSKTNHHHITPHHNHHHPLPQPGLSSWSVAGRLLRFHIENVCFYNVYNTIYLVYARWLLVYAMSCLVYAMSRLVCAMSCWGRYSLKRKL